MRTKIVLFSSVFMLVFSHLPGAYSYAEDIPKYVFSWQATTVVLEGALRAEFCGKSTCEGSKGGSWSGSVTYGCDGNVISSTSSLDYETQRDSSVALHPIPNTNCNEYGSTCVAKSSFKFDYSSTGTAPTLPLPATCASQTKCFSPVSPGLNATVTFETRM